MTNEKETTCIELLAAALQQTATAETVLRDIQTLRKLKNLVAKNKEALKLAKDIEKEVL